MSRIACLAVCACLAAGGSLLAQPRRPEAQPRRHEAQPRRHEAQPRRHEDTKKASRLVGWVSDGHCATQHMKDGGEACVRKCIAGATHVNPEWTPGGMVFVTEDRKVWKVDNADALWGYESRRVEIEGDLNTESGSVRVAKFVGVKPVK